jgi:histone acetyltransferase SAS3
MAEPGRLMGQTTSINDLDDVDADGEYEEDDMMYEQAPAVQPQDDVHTTDAEGSDVDAEGEEVDDDEDDSEPVGAVKIAAPDDAFSEDEEDHDGEHAAESFSDAKTTDSEADSSSESEAENQWQAESEGEEGREGEKSDPNVCV